MASAPELATLGKDSLQIRGALRMLEQDDAERLLGLCQEQIDSYANPETIVGDDDLELLAESLSGLGFYIEAFEQQRPNRQRLIAPLLAKRLGEAPPAPDDRAPETVEDAVEDLRNVLPTLVAEIRRAPTDATARAELTARLTDLVDDATLIDDDELVAQAQAALAELDSGGTVALEAAVTAIAESGATGAAPAPTISAETQRLLAVDATGLDAELLEIYLIEAAEVLDTVAASRGELERNPNDREALRSARRQFHTLKGSGRMVGLTEFGDVAWDVEKIHNRLLEEEHAVTPAALAMIEVAETNFRRWVGALKDTGTSPPIRRNCTPRSPASRRSSAPIPKRHRRRRPGGHAGPATGHPGCSGASASSPLPTAGNGYSAPRACGSMRPRRRWAGSRRRTTARTPAPRSSNSRRSARCPPARMPATKFRCRPMSSSSATSGYRPISTPFSSTRRRVVSPR